VICNHVRLVNFQHPQFSDQEPIRQNAMAAPVFRFRATVRSRILSPPPVESRVRGHKAIGNLASRSFATARESGRVSGVRILALAVYFDNARLQLS